MPSGTGGHLKFADIATWEQLKRPVYVLAVIKLGAFGLTERFEPGGVDEI